MSNDKPEYPPEPWNIHEDEEGGLFLQGSDGSGTHTFEAMRRIVACVNACQGISTEALEAGVVGGMIEAIEGLLSILDASRGKPWSGGLAARARAVLGKVKPPL